MKGYIASCGTIVLFVLAAASAKAEGPRAIFGLETRCEKAADGQGRARVDALNPEGPAAKAGFKLADRLIRLGGKPVCASNDLDYLRSLSAFEPNLPIAAEVLRGGELLRLELVPTQASPEHLAALAAWMEKLRLCFEEGNCQPCMAPSESESCAADTDEMRILEAAEELDRLVKSRPEGVVFDLVRDRQGGNVKISSSEIAIPSGFDPRRSRYLAPRLGDLSAGQSMRLRLSIDESGKGRILILELPHTDPPTGAIKGNSP